MHFTLQCFRLAIQALRIQRIRDVPHRGFAERWIIRKHIQRRNFTQRAADRLLHFDQRVSTHAVDDGREDVATTLFEQVNEGPGRVDDLFLIALIPFHDRDDVTAQVVGHVRVEIEFERGVDTAEIGTQADDVVAMRLQGFEFIQHELEQVILTVTGDEVPGHFMAASVHHLVRVRQRITRRHQFDDRVCGLLSTDNGAKKAQPIGLRGQQFHQPERNHRLAALRFRAGHVNILCHYSEHLSVGFAARHVRVGRQCQTPVARAGAPGNSSGSDEVRRVYLTRQRDHPANPEHLPCAITRR